MSLMIVLSSSSFFYDEYLYEKVEQHRLSTDDITRAKTYNRLAVVESAFREMTTGSKQWLHYAYMLAPYYGDIAYELALYFQPKSSDQVTTLALSKRHQQYQYWLHYAANLKYQPAIKPLALLLIQQGEYRKAQAILQPYHQHTELVKLAFINALSLGDKKLLYSLKSMLEKHAELSDFNGRMNEYLAVLNVNITASNHQQVTYLTYQNIFKKHCDYIRTIQPYATNLSDLNKLEHLITQANQHPLSQYFCFLSVRYVPLADLSCLPIKQLRQPINSLITHKSSKVNAIQCDEARWPKNIKHDLAKYRVLLLPRGGANVHRDNMYLDRNDTINVFLHELSHFLGFVDEYPLVKDHIFCQNRTTQKALNVVLLPKYWLGEQSTVRNKILNSLPWRHAIHDNTPIVTQLHKQKLSQEQLQNIPQSLLKQVGGNNRLWRLGTPIIEGINQVGVYSSLTCSNNTKNVSTEIPQHSIKPLYQRTALEYFELEFPALYLQLIQHNQ